MAEIKSYTDLEQSRKLAEFIPRETADLHYDLMQRVRLGEDPFLTPCWSLAALINLLPQHIETGMGYLQLVIDKNWDGKTCAVVYENRDSYKRCRNDNLVDSCVEMILRLHEMGYKKWPRK